MKKASPPRRASIVTIGNEVLSGRVVDTNAANLGKELFSIGIPVVSCYTIGDDVDAIVRSLNLACNDADIVLTTGGLGPTDDDVTREAFAKFLGVELQLQDELLRAIEEFFARRERQMPAKNRCQAYIPAGAKALFNNIGTAPGIMSTIGDKLIFAMPGVPREMEQMFMESVLPELRRFASGQAMVSKKLRCFGVGESAIAEMLGPIMERGRNPLVNCTAERGIITLEIVAISADENEAQALVEKDEKLIRTKLGKLVYGVGNQSLAEVVGGRLARQGKKLAVAESCTGGTLAKLLTDVAGASRYFTHGWFTYSNDAKISELGVEPKLIEGHGAVSSEVAGAMAEGARRKAGTDFAIAITGIAGPTGATEQKPVGLVYISVSSKGGLQTKRYVMSGDRDLVRLRAALTALDVLRLELQV
jgi:nicotinamide-nucleotide amidase